MASYSAGSPTAAAAAYSPPPSPNASAYKYSSIEEVLEDISSRFILNLPDEELASAARVCFQVEQAHWFYEDWVRDINPEYPSLPLKKFSEMLFRACPLIQHWSADHEQEFQNFLKYKTQVPVCGAIMLNEKWDKCILVKGWKSSSGWGFPKGKINQDEPPHKCAIREVLEETGYDLSKKIDPDNFVTHSNRTDNGAQHVTLYIVPGVPEDYPFETKTRKEISKIQWFRLVDLPTFVRGKRVDGKFYNVHPFINELRRFVNNRKPRLNGGNGSRAGNGHISQASLTMESSSQSSTDPQTPSPQQAEAMVTSVVHPEEPLDSEMTRLLNGLALSAAGVAQSVPDVKNGPMVNGNKSRQIPPSSRPTSTAPPFWDVLIGSVASGPPVVENPTSQSNAQAPLHPPRRDAQTNVLQHSPVRNNNGTTTRAIPNPGSATSPSAPLNSSGLATVSPSVSSASPMMARMTAARRGSTADISPYLRKAAAVPTSGKTLQHIALLESVANEAEALSQSRPPSVMGGPMRQNVVGGMHGSVVHPGLSASVPPHHEPGMVMMSNQPPPPVHSAYHTPGRPQFGPTPTMPYHSPAPSFPVNDDPFQVRPRTAAAMRATAHPPVRGPYGNEPQLLSILSNTPTPASRRPVNGGLPPLPESVPMPMSRPDFGGLIPTPLGRRGPAPVPLRVMPSTTSHSIGGAAVPGSAPAYATHFPPASTPDPSLLPRGFQPQQGPTPTPAPGRPAPPSANLLSMLNTPGGPGVHNSAGHH